MAQPYPKTFTTGKPSPVFPLGLPANDNSPFKPWRPPGTPANDNKKVPSPWDPPPAKKRPDLGPYIRGLGKGLARWTINDWIFDNLGPGGNPIYSEADALDFSMPGWTETGRCVSGPGSVMASYDAWLSYCGTHLAADVTLGTTPTKTSFGTNWRYRLWALSPRPFPSPNYFYHCTWEKIVPKSPAQPDPVAPTIPGQKIWEVPYSWPATLPGLVPWGQPLLNPFPDPVPVRLAPQQPRTNPWGETVRGPRPNPRTFPNRPDLPHKPPPRTKERKAMLALGGPMAWIVGALTESMDAVDALYRALPEWLRKRLWKEHGGYMSPWDKANALYRHLGDVDIGKAVNNLIMDEIEDRAWGALGRITATANRIRGMPGGLELGDALEGGPRFDWTISK